MLEKSQLKKIFFLVFCRFTIVSEEEWTKLSDFYSVDYEITAIKYEDGYITNPGKITFLIQLRWSYHNIKKLIFHTKIKHFSYKFFYYKS